MKTTLYGIDPDPVTVEVRMMALAAEGLTPESFGVTDFQLRYHLDPSRSRELRELIKIDPIGRERLSKFLPENHPASSGNGQSEPNTSEDTPRARWTKSEKVSSVFEDVPGRTTTPAGNPGAAPNGHAKDTHPGIADQVYAAIGRGPSGGGVRGPRPTEAILTFADQVTPEPIDWIWNGWIAKSKLQLIVGAPEAGKTTIALSFAATISAGHYWPDGARSPRGKVLIWISEDGLADTLVPRLTRMGADLSNIAFITQSRPPNGKPRPFNPAIDMPALAAKAKEIGNVVLTILDPVVAAVPASKNSHNNAETRNGLQPVVDFAEATGSAVYGISHFTKEPEARILSIVSRGLWPSAPCLASS
jgi:hypothetical protein